MSDLENELPERSHNMQTSSDQPESSSGDSDPIQIQIPKLRSTHITGNPELPRPERLPRHYTQERVQAGLDWANGRLTSTDRKPTPSTHRALLVYAGSCVAVLEAIQNEVEKSELDQAQDDLYKIEIMAQDHAWYSQIPDRATHSMAANLVELKQMVFYARYGDYVRDVCKTIRWEARVHDIAGWENIGGTVKWNEISKKLKNEEPDYSVDGTSKPDRTPTYRTIYEAAQSTGLDFKEVLTSIHMYGDRNANMHAGLEELVKSQSISDIAKTIYADLQDLSKLCPPDWPDRELCVRATILSLRDRWFDQSAGADDPGKWFASEALQASIKRAAKSDPATAKAAAEAEKKRVTELTTQVLKKLHEDGFLVNQILNPPAECRLPPADAPVPSRKRRERSSLTSDVANEANDRKASFEQLMKRHKNLNGQALVIMQQECLALSQARKLKTDEHGAVVIEGGEVHYGKQVFAPLMDKQRVFNADAQQHRKTFGSSPPPQV